MKRIAVLGLLLAAGCSSAYDRAWEEAGHPAHASSAILVEGRWSGLWHSDVTGHEGALRCMLTNTPNSGANAWYHATYAWWIFPFSFEYVLPMTIEHSVDGGARVRGSAELGCWVSSGLYEYEGRFDGDTFVASYNSGFDRGVFRLKRVQ